MFFVAPLLQRFVEQAMGARWRTSKLQLTCFVVLILGLGFRGSSSLNLEGKLKDTVRYLVCKVPNLVLKLMVFFVGSTLLKFKTRIDSDPYNSLANWNSEDGNPCNWKGVHCVDGKVHML